MPIPSVVGNPIVTGLDAAVQGYQQGLSNMYQRRMQAQQMQGENLKNQAMASYYGGRNNATVDAATARANGTIVNGQYRTFGDLTKDMGGGIVKYSDLPPGVQSAYAAWLQGGPPSQPQGPGAGNPQTPFDPSGNYVTPNQAPPQGAAPQAPGGPPAPYAGVGVGPTTIANIGKTGAQSNLYGAQAGDQEIDAGTKFLNTVGGLPQSAQPNAVSVYNQVAGTKYPVPGTSIMGQIPQQGPVYPHTSLPPLNGVVGQVPYYSPSMKTTADISQANAAASANSARVPMYDSLTQLNAAKVPLTQAQTQQIQTNTALAPGKAAAYDNQMNASANYLKQKGITVVPLAAADIQHLAQSDAFMESQIHHLNLNDPRVSQAVSVYKSLLAAKGNADLLGNKTASAGYATQIANIQPVITGLSQAGNSAPNPSASGNPFSSWMSK